MKKINLANKIIFGLLVFGMVSCCSPSNKDIQGAEENNTALKKFQADSENGAFKVLGAPGNGVCISATKGVSGSADDVVIFTMDLYHVTHANHDIHFTFDLTPEVGKLYTANQGGNGFRISMPYSGKKMMMMGPGGYNQYLTNNDWNYWMKRDGESGATQYGPVTKNSNTWMWFDSTAQTVRSYGEDGHHMTVTVMWYLKDKKFGYYTGIDGSTSNCIEISGCLNILAGSTYYPCVYINGPLVGDNVILDNIVFRTSSGVSLGSTTFDNLNNITYTLPESNGKIYVSSEERTRLVSKASYEWGVDFVVDVPAGKKPLVLQLTDIQIIDSFQMMYLSRLGTGSSNYLWSPDKMYLRAFKYMRETLELVKEKEGRYPDLIALSGDNTYGEFDFNMTTIDAIVNELDSYGIPFGFCYGNHDQEAATGKDIWIPKYPDLNYDYALFDINGNTAHAHSKLNSTVNDMDWRYARSKNCLFSKGHYGVEGHANYVIGLRQNGKLINCVYFMDSHGNSVENVDMEVYSAVGFRDSQVNWFSESRTGNDLKNVPGIGFCHHPFYGFGQQARWYGVANPKNGITGHIGDESFNDFRVVHNVEEDKRITVNPGDNGCAHVEVAAGQYVDTDLSVHNINKSSGMLGWFFGHEHQLNMTVTYEGVKYGFGVKASEYDSHTLGEVGGTLLTLDNTEGSKKVIVDKIYSSSSK